MTGVLLLKFAHLLLFVYWLGGDLGTFYASRLVADGELSVPARAAAARIMFAVDQAPRLCMPLVLGSGLQLAASLGLAAIPPGMMVLVWLLSLVWVLAVILLHAGQGSDGARRIAIFDRWLRVFVMAACGLAALSSLAGFGPLHATWLAAKLLIFAGLVACGLLIRRQLRPFADAFSAMLLNGPSPAGDEVLRRSISGCRPYVYLIWLGLLISAALGTHLLGR